jgi:phage shock protein PspC (stress-responsive transcriptional regulator)
MMFLVNRILHWLRQPPSPGPGPWRRPFAHASWGVCHALATGLRLNLHIVRGIALLCILLSPPLALLGYFALTLVLPRERGPNPRRRHLLFLGGPRRVEPVRPLPLLLAPYVATM